MDPPSFTRKILQSELNISENDLGKYQKILQEKAAIIQRKLTLGESDSENEAAQGNEEESKEQSLQPVTDSSPDKTERELE